MKNRELYKTQDLRPLAKIMELAHLDDFPLVFLFIYLEVNKLIRDKMQNIFI